MQALLEARLPARISAVISNEPGAKGLEVARGFGVPTRVVHHRDFADRAAFDRALMDAVGEYDPHLSFWRASCASSRLLFWHASKAR